MDENQLLTHTRINDILLGPLERPLLARLAKKMPAWVTPDMLTGLGLFASLLIFISYWMSSYNKAFLWLASFSLLLNWFGDSLDGSLARYRKIERPRYGMFIDHVTDTISEILVFVGIGLSPYVNMNVALIGLTAYLSVSILVYLVMVTRGVFRISMAKIGPTEIRVMGIITNTLMFFLGVPKFKTPFGIATLFDVIVVCVSIMLAVFFLIETINTGKILEREDAYSRQRRAENEEKRKKRMALREQKKLAQKQKEMNSSEREVKEPNI
jgi:phosphatidylglycerophosphate synthase